MTDLPKALAFAGQCLPTGYPFDPEDMGNIQRALDTFLAKRFLIQINRGTSTLFKWTVIVALQDLTASGAHSNQARADSDDLFDAIFDACVHAAKMDKP